jgi:hypothetical protein
MFTKNFTLILNYKSMKTKTLLIAPMMLLFVGTIFAQTADEIIAKYLQATGGKEKIIQLTSVVLEGTIDVMGNSGPMKMITLNGKGFKSEIDIQGSSIVSCFNEKEGWSVNPFMGVGSPETMPEAQYKTGKDQIFVGAPFVFYAEKGYKAELAGNEKIGDINALKIKMTSPDNTVVLYLFDPATGYLIRSIQQVDMQGSMVDNTMTFSDWKDVEGFPQPHKLSINIGGQFDMTMTISKVEYNKPIDAAIFTKP